MGAVNSCCYFRGKWKPSSQLRAQLRASRQKHVWKAQDNRSCFSLGRGCHQIRALLWISSLPGLNRHWEGRTPKSEEPFGSEGNRALLEASVMWHYSHHRKGKRQNNNFLWGIFLVCIIFGIHCDTFARCKSKLPLQRFLWLYQTKGTISVK